MSTANSEDEPFLYLFDPLYFKPWILLIASWIFNLLKGTSIYELKLLMGHSSVTTTEVYSNMNLRRVRQDFPKLRIADSKDVKFGKKDTLLKDTKIPYSGYVL